MTVNQLKRFVETGIVPALTHMHCKEHIMAIVAVGKVSRLYVNRGNTSIRLDIDWEKTGPANGYFKLRLDHVNYNALYSLALAAAVNRFPLRIRTVKEIVKDDRAEVEYMVVDWAAGQDDAD